jgi:hypothetical protein
MPGPVSASRSLLAILDRLDPGLAELDQAVKHEAQKCPAALLPDGTAPGLYEWKSRERRLCSQSGRQRRVE